MYSHCFIIPEGTNFLMASGTTGVKKVVSYRHNFGQNKHSSTSHQTSNDMQTMSTFPQKTSWNLPNLRKYPKWRSWITSQSDGSVSKKYRPQSSMILLFREHSFMGSRQRQRDLFRCTHTTNISQAVTLYALFLRISLLPSLLLLFLPCSWCLPGPSNDHYYHNLYLSEFGWKI